jgi:hypothetical protein
MGDSVMNKKLYLVSYRTRKGAIYGLQVWATDRQEIPALMRMRGVDKQDILSIDEVTDE